ncbi:MAG TPA: ATP-binding protein [Verrucomicrobiales bacterium]|nr:ATP-binding protein [Verrucomicrobiales bacterium]
MDTIRDRWLIRQLQAALKALPVVVITGARQTGKTTLAQVLPQKRTFLSLDDLGILGQAQSDPDSLLASRPVTLDEVQRAPELLLSVKRQVDRQRKAGDFLLTGSANLLLMGNVAESLAGRAVYLELPPFCPSEWQEQSARLTPLDRLFEPDFDPDEWPDEPGDWPAWLLRGGFPSALLAPGEEARQLWFTGYVQTYLERDLRQLSAVASLPDFQRVMALAANRCARLLNQSELARDAAMPQPTVHRHLNLLETGCLLVRLSPYATNPTTGLVKAKKLLWSDCGLAAWLAGIKSVAGLANRLDQGFWLKQTLFQSLQSWRALDPAGRRLYFWRDRSGREVDFVLEKDGVLVALEIKASRQVAPSDGDGIDAFRRSLGKSRRFHCGAVLHAGSSRSLGQALWALPWGWLVPKTHD